MNHAVTIGEILRALGGLVAVVLIGIGLLMFFAGSMSDAPAEGDAAGKQGCAFGVCGLILLALMLAACATAPQYRDRIVEVDKPVAVQPIKASDVPPLPGQLGKRPPTASQAADAALAGRCDAIAFVLRAYPLLLLSAGLPPAQAPHYPECEKK